MTQTTAPVPTFSERMLSSTRRLAPGMALSAAVALAAYLAEPLFAAGLRAATGWSYTLPAIVIALLIGIALNGPASKPVFEPGMTWCVKKLLRIAIALLGLRIALSDIVDLGLAPALLIIASMVLTVMSGVWLARWFKVGDGYGALAGAATAVCGASATLATATVVPNYPQKGADVAFTVVAANAVSTLVMVAYPPLCVLLGLDVQTTGIMLGATIHDMAQVVGAGYAVSEPVGNTAVIVKLFRVFLLLPAVLAIGWWYTRHGAAHDRAKVPVPVFALVFLGLCVLNSLVALAPGLMPVYTPIKTALVQISSWGLLIAIAALGLGTSLSSLLRIGWRHIAVFTGTTLVILLTVIVGLLSLS
ncbi:YeiH family protein [Microvirga roseola]|uniref:YeiH family protein n=1 Tax=Microvirga roseola TaxID=2883126 RepID=UPI001E2859CC|nr:putative sulfate exporter family transporter [Microvirga roseola]